MIAAHEAQWENQSAEKKQQGIQLLI